MCKILREIGGLSTLELLEKYDISLSPPIDIKRLIDNIGIRLIRYDFSNAERAGNYPLGSIIGAALLVQHYLMETILIFYVLIT